MTTTTTKTPTATPTMHPTVAILANVNARLAKAHADRDLATVMALEEHRDALRDIVSDLID